MLYRWLQARNGTELDANLQRNLLDTIARIEEVLHLFDEADSVLDAAARSPLTRGQIGMSAPTVEVGVGREDSDETG